MPDPEFKAAVGLSREWDAYGAGREVAQNTLDKLKAKPDFFLLFTTIHYEKHGGFKKFLEGVWDVLPKGTPLIGGTVAGFINPQGCYTRGATALAVSYPNMDVAIGIGHNTKRNPQKAAKECAQTIKEKLSKSNFENKIAYEIISGSVILDLPGIHKRRVLDNKLYNKVSLLIQSGILNKFQLGTGCEEDVLSELVNQLPDFKIIGGSSIEYANMLNNYQFFGKNIEANSIVMLAMSTDLKMKINTTCGLEDTGKELEITQIGPDGKTLIRINNKPALDAYLDAIGMDRDLVDERLHRRTFFTPLISIQDGILYPNVIGLVLGEHLLVGFKPKNKKLKLFSASGRSLIDAVVDNLKSIDVNQPKFAFIVSCGARLETLGANIFKTREILKSYLNETPFLLIYTGGEDVYSKEIGIRHLNESFNVSVLT